MMARLGGGVFGNRRGEGGGRGEGVPSISVWRWRLFAAYAERYVAKHVHTVRCLRGSVSERWHDRPLVVYLNHAGWWDPLICLLVARRYFPGRPIYAPIEESQLERYGFFRKLGFFGVEPETRRGAAKFLRVGEDVLRDERAMLWLTPQGRFADVRERPVRFKGGLGHLATRLGRAEFVPLAVEYTYWEERTPEVLVGFGEGIAVEEGLAGWGAADWTAALELRLERAQDRLAAVSARREAGAFEVVLGGRSGVGGVYDRWRSWRARWKGEAFDGSHGRL